MPSISFRDAANFMDAAQPSTSMRDLIARHRWLGNPSTSLRQVLERHKDDRARSFHFLNYNTFLLPGINLEWDLAAALHEIGWTVVDAILAQGADLQTLLSAMNTTAEDVLEAVFPTPAALADALHIAHSTLEKAVADVLDIATFGLINLAEQLTYDIVFKVFARPAIDALKELSIDVGKMMSALHIDPIYVLARLILLLGRGVLSLFGVNVPYPLRVGAKPALEARAVAIGQATAAHGYDVMAFSEVWRQVPSARDAIVAGWQGSAKPLSGAPAMGPDNSARALDSGLMRLCAGNARIVEAIAHPFAAAGSVLFDTDAYATKGILLTRMKLTDKCTIDLYGTHLLSGGDGPLSFLKSIVQAVGDGVSDAACNQRRLAQVAELVQFYRDTHQSGNIGIVCGDTNIIAETTAGATPTYTQLCQELGDLGLYDLWVTQRGFIPPLVDGAGGSHGAEDGKQQRFDGICSVLQTEISHDLPTQPQIGMCNEAVATAGERIDFVFVEAPTAQHGADIDFTRLVRNPFVWQGLPDDQLYLSDHLGQEFRILVNDR